MDRLTVLAAAVAVGAYVRVVDAQGLFFSYDSSTPAPVPSSGVIHVGTVGGSPPHLLQVWDSDLVNGIPDDDLVVLIVDGNLDTNGGELQILVAGPADGWPDLVTPLSAPAVRNLGPITGNAFEFTDPNLRRRARLAAFAVGDVRGTVSIGQIQRLQCGLPFGSPSGTISASLISSEINNSFRTNEPSIGYVSAGIGISGSITAVGDPANFDPTIPSTYASIFKIVVGPFVDNSVVGVQGDVLAEAGAITRIFTTGPIGSAQHAIRIWAGNSIAEVRALSEDPAGNQTTHLQKDFFADVRSNRYLATHPAVPLTGNTHQDGGCPTNQSPSRIH